MMPWAPPGMLMPPAPFAIPRIKTLPKLPTNTLNLSIGDVVKAALEMRRTGGGGTYVPLPYDKLPDPEVDTSKDKETWAQPQFKQALEEYFRELELIDPKRKRSSSRSRKRERSEIRRKRRRDSRSRSRSKSRSRSRSMSS